MLLILNNWPLEFSEESGLSQTMQTLISRAHYITSLSSLNTDATLSHFGFTATGVSLA